LAIPKLSRFVGDVAKFTLRQVSDSDFLINSNYYVEFLPNGRENDNFYPPYPSDAFEDGVKCGRIDFARELMVLLGEQP
jgi:hypothetical protein